MFNKLCDHFVGNIVSTAVVKIIRAKMNHCSQRVNLTDIGIKRREHPVSVEMFTKVKF